MYTFINSLSKSGRKKNPEKIKLCLLSHCSGLFSGSCVILGIVTQDYLNFGTGGTDQRQYIFLSPFESDFVRIGATSDLESRSPACFTSTPDSNEQDHYQSLTELPDGLVGRGKLQKEARLRLSRTEAVYRQSEL